MSRKETEKLMETTFQCVEDDNLGSDDVGVTRLVVNRGVYEIGEKVTFVGDPYRVWEVLKTEPYQQSILTF